MKKFKLLKSTYSWKELLPKIEPEKCLLLKKSDVDYILAWGVESEFQCKKGLFDLNELERFVEKNANQYRFGYLSYDIKNKIEEKLTSDNEDRLNFDDTYFFVPDHILIRKNDQLIYFGRTKVEEIESFLKNKTNTIKSHRKQKITLEEQTEQADYNKNVIKIKEHIQQGNIYEMNYCVNYRSKMEEFDILGSFVKLTERTEAPFSVFGDLGDKAILSASPERFIVKDKEKIISQPIKGTTRRGKNKSEDDQLKLDLLSNDKEISENVMIVDLVRNDLSKIASKNSVNVEKLCAIESFNTVHQLVSTISCSIDKKTSFTEIIQALFPMGSMTGAPKFSAMELSEKYETFKRGLYSGTVGFIEPNGNFDFNVIIRSILYSKQNGEVSCSVGGAITIKSDPNLEYQECILKLEALKDSLC